MIREFSTTVTSQTRGRCSQRVSGASASSTSPACSMPRKAIVTRVGLELLISSPAAVIMDTGYGPRPTSTARPTAPIPASSSLRRTVASRPSSQA